MALKQTTFNIAAFNDSEAGGNNYFAGTIFEVYNTNDTLADIFSDAAGTNPINQDGIENVSDLSGRCNFYIEDGSYHIKIGANKEDFTAGISDDLIGNAAIPYSFDRRADLSNNSVVFTANKILTTKGRDSVGDGLGREYFVSATQVTINDILMASGQYASLKEMISTDVIAQKINIDSTSLPVSLAKNRVGANQDRWVMLFGDSHGWGQGAPDWDPFSGLQNFSRHSGYPHSKGYMYRIEEFIRNKLQIQENVYCLAHPQIQGRVTNPDAGSMMNMDIDRTFPLMLESGYLDCQSSNLLDISANTFTNFYAPVARQDVDGYSLTEYREKLSKGLFKNMIMELRPEDIDEFSHEGKQYFVELTPDPTYPGSGAGFTKVTFGNQGTIVAEWNTTSDTFYLISKNISFPQWFANGERVYLSGYGVVEIVSILGNGAIQLRNDNGTEIGSAAAGYIYPGMKIYPRSYIERCVLRMEMIQPARAMYVNVKHKANGGKLRISFTDSISGGAALRAYVNPNVNYRNSSNSWIPKFTNGVASVSLVTPDHQLVSAGAATADGFGVEINTGELSPGVTEELIYRIDWAAKQQGQVYLEAVCDPGESVETRGVIWDNNKIVNCSMGAHTVGAFIGRQSSNAGETRDHVADILNYTPIQPSHVITQIPFVNEYIKQNSTAIFKQDLKDFINRFKDHLSTSNNYNTQGVDFIFFTSLRNREIAFEGGSEASVTYDDYVQAAKEFCEDNNCAFVDCEQRLFDLVEQGRIDYQRLFNDSNHPSDYANEMIFNTLKSEYLEAQIG